MSSGIASLHKVLKDDIRQKIILLLNDKGSLGYTELLDATKAGSTGLLNYHLKVLGNLLVKDEKGQYRLTEKGKIASRLLTEFPDENNQLDKRKRQRIFWSGAVVSQIIILLTVWILHWTGNIDFANAIRSTVAAISGMALAYLGYRSFSDRPKAGSSKEKFRMKICYAIGGAWLTLVIGFFGPVLLTLILMNLGGPNIFKLIDATIGATLYFFLLLFLAMPIGGISGYYLGKRNHFNKPKWITWIDEKFGFY